MLVFGGTDDHQLYDDVWALSLNRQPAWSRVPAVAPDAVVRRYPSAIYDPEGGRLVVWGGSRHGVSLRDMWALPLEGPPVWTEVMPPNEAPEPRDGHSAIYDPRGRRMIIFGGGYDLNDTWALPLERRRGRARPDDDLPLGTNAASFELREPHPNPSPGETAVEFTLARSGHVSLAVYDAAGRGVRRLAEGEFSPGSHGLRWDGRDADGHPAPTGLYFLRLEGGGSTITRKTVIAR
jgi:hypothetical protein